MFVAIAMTCDLVSAVAESYLIVSSSLRFCCGLSGSSDCFTCPFSFLSHLYGHSGTFCLWQVTCEMSVKVLPKQPWPFEPWTHLDLWICTQVSGTSSRSLKTCRLGREASIGPSYPKSGEFGGRVAAWHPWRFCSESSTSRCQGNIKMIGRTLLLGFCVVSC